MTINEVRLRILTQIFRIIELNKEVDPKFNFRINNIITQLNLSRKELLKLERKYERE